MSGFCYLKVFTLCVTAGRADDQDANSTFVLDDRNVCYEVAMRTIALVQAVTCLRLKASTQNSKPHTIGA